MNPSELMEIGFNVTYLVVIYILVILMAIRHRRGLATERRVSRLFIGAFLLLALGDTGHVGFRAAALLGDGLEANAVLVGAGALSTAVTVTFFYMLMMEIFRVYTGGRRDGIYWFVMIGGLARLVFMAFPGNRWGGPIPLGYSYIRNAMLTVMGLVIAVLYLRAGLSKRDRTLKSVAVCIFLSYGFYLPVILFVHLEPMLGLLMIPKTCAYVAVAIIGYRRLYSRTGTPES